MLNISTAAIEKLKGILAEEGEGNSLRVMVMPVGHGLQYMLTAEKETNDDDIIEEMSGIKVIMDSDSAPLLDGAKIDYVEEMSRVGFVISNPNAQLFGGGCACGSGGACACGGTEVSGEAATCDCGEAHGEESHEGHTH